MRHIFKLILFAVVMLALGGIANGQSIVTGTGYTTQLIYQRGGYGADSVFGIPVRDTFCNNFLSPVPFRCKGRITIQPSTGNMYYHNGSYWVATSSGGGSGADSNVFVTHTQLDDSLDLYVRYVDTAGMLAPYLRVFDPTENATIGTITTIGSDVYNSAQTIGALGKIYKQYADSTYQQYTDTTALAAKFWRLGGNTLTQDTAFGSRSNHTINFISNATQRGRLVSSGEWEFGTRTSTGDVLVQGTNPVSKIYRLASTVGLSTGWDYQLNNSSLAQSTYAQTRVSIIANTAGAHSGDFSILTSNAGTLATRFNLGNTGRTTLTGVSPLEDVLVVGNNQTRKWFMGVGQGTVATANDLLLVAGTSFSISTNPYIAATGGTSWVLGNSPTVVFETNGLTTQTLRGPVQSTTSGDVFRMISRASVSGSGITGSVNMLHLDNSDAGGTYQPTSGTNTFRSVYAHPRLNSTGTHTGVMAGVTFDPVIVAASKTDSIKAFEALNEFGWGAWQKWPTAKNYFSGNTGIGGGPDATEKFKVTGNAIITGYTIESVTTSAAATLTLSTSENYIFTGTTTTWTIPAVSGTTGRIYKLKNRGSGNVTINTTASANELYTTAAANTYSLTPGSAIILVSDGSFWNVE